MSCVLTAITTAFAQSDRVLSLDQALTPRRVLHVNGAYFMIRDAPSGQETMAIHGHSQESRTLAAVWDSSDNAAQFIRDICAAGRMIKEISSMCKFALQRIVSLGLFFSFLPGTLAASDKTVSRDFIVEPPTLISLGFEWNIDGDDNRNAEVSVQYRKKGEQAWKHGLHLLRLQREQTYSGAFHYTAANMFAGSIFDLEPDAEYEWDSPPFAAPRGLQRQTGDAKIQDPSGVQHGYRPGQAQRFG